MKVWSLLSFDLLCDCRDFFNCFRHQFAYFKRKYSSYDVKRKSLSCGQPFGAPWTIHSMEFSRPEYWSG